MDNFTDIRAVSLDQEVIDKLNEKLGLARKYLLDVAAEGVANKVLQEVTDVLVALQLVRLHTYREYESLSDRLVVSKRFLPAIYASLAALNLRREGGLGIDVHHLSNLSVITTSSITIVLVPSSQCLSISCGIALALRRESTYSGAKVYVLLDEHELSEGYLWEIASLPTKYGLDNIVAITYVTEHVGSNTLTLRWASLGWRVVEVNYGNVARIINVFSMLNTTTGKPTVILIHASPNQVVEVRSELERDLNEANTI